MGKTYNISGHTIEFRSGSGSLDPWSSEYSRQIGLSLMCTSDIVDYVIVDGEKIYRQFSCSKELQLINDILDNAISSWEELMFFYKDIFEDFIGNLSDLKKELDEIKEKHGKDTI